MFQELSKFEQETIDGGVKIGDLRDVATGIGGALGGLAGAAGGPGSAVAGGVVGGFLGGAAYDAMNAIAESFNPHFQTGVKWKCN